MQSNRKRSKGMNLKLLSLSKRETFITHNILNETFNQLTKFFSHSTIRFHDSTYKNILNAAHTVVTDPTPAWYFFKFYPPSIDINVGDTISFEMTAGQQHFEHTINFNPPVPQGDGSVGPYQPVGFPIITGSLENGQPNMTLSFPPHSLITINPAMGNIQPGTGADKLKAVHNSTAHIGSGFFVAFPSVTQNINAPKKFEVTFTEQGSFTGYCVPHAQGRMLISVNVRAVDTPYPKNATVIASETAIAMGMDKQSSTWRNRMYARDDMHLKTVPSEWFGSTPSTVSNSSKQYFVRAGIWSPIEGGMASLSRFVPDHIQIYVGDVLHFYSEDVDAHTITIHNGSYNGNTQVLPGGRAWPDFPSTPSSIDKPYQMKDYAHSGLILGEFVPGPPFWQTNPFSVQFTQAGTFHLTCLIHAGMGMEGTIYVRPTPQQSCAGEAGATSVVNINFANMFART